MSSQQGLGRNFQDQVAAEQSEDKVRRPRSQEGRQLADVSHRFKEARYCPINNCNGYGGGYACNRTSATGREGKRNREHRHYQRNCRVGQLLLELDSQANDIEAALL